MSGRKRRSLLGNAPGDGSPAAADTPEVEPVSEAPSAPEPPPEPPRQSVEQELPPPVSSKARRRLVTSETAGRRVTYPPEPTDERPKTPRAAEPMSEPMSGLVSFSDGPEPDPDEGSRDDPSRDGLSARRMPTQDPLPARRTASRDPDLAYRPPSLEPEGPDGDESEVLAKSDKSRSPFGGLKVVEKSSGKKPASPFFRSAPPEDAAVYESAPQVGSARRATLPETAPPAFEKVSEPRIPKKSATRGAPMAPESGRMPGNAPRSRLRVEKPEPDSKVGHKDPLSWNEVAPNHDWGSTPNDSETPAPPPMKRQPVAERIPVASTDVVSAKKAPSGTDKAPLESIDSNASPSLPGLFDGSTPPPSPRKPAAEAHDTEPAVKRSSTVPPPPKPITRADDDEDEDRRSAGCLPVSTIIALLLIPLSISMTMVVAYAFMSPRAPEPEKPRPVIPAAPRIPLPSEIPPPIEDTTPPEPEPDPVPVVDPVPGVAQPKPKPKPPQPKPPVLGAPVTEDRGLVKVRANKHGLIHVNGVAKSFTPDQLSLPPGTYTIMVSIPDGPSLTQTVTVKKDKTEPLEFTFP